MDSEDTGNWELVPGSPFEWADPLRGRSAARSAPCPPAIMDGLSASDREMVGEIASGVLEEGIVSGPVGRFRFVHCPGDEDFGYEVYVDRDFRPEVPVPSKPAKRKAPEAQPGQGKDLAPLQERVRKYFDEIEPEGAAVMAGGDTAVPVAPVEAISAPLPAAAWPPSPELQAIKAELSRVKARLEELASQGAAISVSPTLPRGRARLQWSALALLFVGVVGAIAFGVYSREEARREHMETLRVLDEGRAALGVLEGRVGAHSTSITAVEAQLNVLAQPPRTAPAEAPPAAPPAKEPAKGLGKTATDTDAKGAGAAEASPESNPILR